NKNKGFYANHHLGGIIWENNTGYRNPSNFCMLNRKSASETVDVPGYGHTIKNNISFMPRSSEQHIVDVNLAECLVENNSFYPSAYTLSSQDFISLDETLSMAPRNADGRLPDIDFLKLRSSSQLFGLNMGYAYTQISNPPHNSSKAR